MEEFEATQFSKPPQSSPNPLSDLDDFLSAHTKTHAQTDPLAISKDSLDFDSGNHNVETDFQSVSTPPSNVSLHSTNRPLVTQESEEQIQTSNLLDYDIDQRSEFSEFGFDTKQLDDLQRLPASNKILVEEEEEYDNGPNVYNPRDSPIEDNFKANVVVTDIPIAKPQQPERIELREEDEDEDDSLNEDIKPAQASFMQKEPDLVSDLYSAYGLSESPVAKNLVDQILERNQPDDFTQLGSGDFQRPGDKEPDDRYDETEVVLEQDIPEECSDVDDGVEEVEEDEVIPQFVDRHFGAEPVVRPVATVPEPEPVVQQVVAEQELADTTVSQEDGFEADDEDGDEITYLTGRDFYSALFDPKNLPPKVVDLIYWRDLKKTGAVFGGGLVVLLSLCMYTILTLVTYLSLLGLLLAGSFRVYKNVLTAVQKSNDGHPFKEYLERDMAISKARAHHVADCALGHVNSVVVELRRLFLVEDLVDSIKFGLLLWVLTYIGSWFNGLTLVILIYVGVFSLPIVYETHKEKIDLYVNMAQERISEVITLIKSKLPWFKPKEQ